MKILAMEVETEGVKPEHYAPYLEAEARHVWALYQRGQIRELYFRGDQPQAILMLECTDLEAARQTLQTLPLVQAGLIHFDVIPLLPYPGFARLFRE